MADDVDLFIKRLEETITFLRHYGIDFWADWMQRNHDFIVGRDFYGVTGVLRAFGGMGSFNDLYIHPINGHPLSEDEVKPANERLAWLQGELYRLSHMIKREVESG